MDTSNKGTFKGTWIKGNNGIKVVVSIIIFNEDDSTIVYCPALDLSGYGTNEEEALVSFKIVFDQYILYATNKKTLFEDLVNYGWSIPKHKRQNITPPQMSVLLSNNSEFNRVFNTLPYRKIDEELFMPAQ